MFSKTTYITGHKPTGVKGYALSGHWKIEKAIRYARNHGMIGEFTITHGIYDGSGHGRGGDDGEWRVSADDIPIKRHDWAEGNYVSGKTA